MTGTDALGYMAASLVLATFCARSMTTLRLLAIVSNIAFIIYGRETGLWPIFLLHAVMLPLNLCRLREAVRAAPLTAGAASDSAASVAPRLRPGPDLQREALHDGERRVPLFHNCG